MSFTASWRSSDRDMTNISFSEASLSYASIQSATASNRQHALSHKCHDVSLDNTYIVTQHFQSWAQQNKP